MNQSFLTVLCVIASISFVHSASVFYRVGRDIIVPAGELIELKDGEAAPTIDVQSDLKKTELPVAIELEPVVDAVVKEDIIVPVEQLKVAEPVLLVNEPAVILNDKELESVRNFFETDKVEQVIVPLLESEPKIEQPEIELKSIKDDVVAEPIAEKIAEPISEPLVEPVAIVPVVPSKLKSIELVEEAPILKPTVEEIVPAVATNSIVTEVEAVKESKNLSEKPLEIEVKSEKEPEKEDLSLKSAEPIVAEILPSIQEAVVVPLVEPVASLAEPILPALKAEEVPAIVKEIIPDVPVEQPLSGDASNPIVAEPVEEIRQNAPVEGAAAPTPVRPNLIQQAQQTINEIISNNPLTNALNNIRQQSSTLLPALDAPTTQRPQNLIEQFQNGVQNLQNQIASAFQPQTNSGTGDQLNAGETAPVEPPRPTNLIQQIQNAVGQVFNRPNSNDDGTPPANPLQGIVNGIQTNLQNAQNSIQGLFNPNRDPVTAAPIEEPVKVEVLAEPVKIDEPVEIVSHAVEVVEVADKVDKPQE